METQVRMRLMERAIALAEQSVEEDDRVHPRVGAVLADVDGTELVTAFRGEAGPGAHAEFTLFGKAEAAGVDPRGKTLFVTLEPCTRRGLEKIPCAARVERSGVAEVWIGTLDPNPQITGRGEMYLSDHTAVERFPGALKRRLEQLNEEFFAKHRHEHVPAVSMFSGGADADFVPALAGQREGLLWQSLDLITGSDGEVRIFAGNLSWLRELQVGLLMARLRGRRVRLLCAGSAARAAEVSQGLAAASALGAEAAVAARPFGLRGTMTGSVTGAGAMIAIEKTPALHGHVFRAPHDAGILEALAAQFEREWEKAEERVGASEPRVVALDEAWLRDALVAGVPAYAGAAVTIRWETVPVASLRLLPKAVERFKLFRLHQLAALRREFELPAAAAVAGSSWPMVPPIIEERPDGERVVVDGAHRTFAAMRRQEETLEALVVRGVTAPLPARPQADVDQIVERTEKRPRALRYDDYAADHFRPIRRAFQDALGRAAF